MAEEIEQPSAAPTATRMAAGKYRFIAKLGHGGMADVFLALAQGPASFNKLVVVKRHLADGEGEIQMFLDEAKLSAHLSHPNIVHTYEIGEEQGGYYMVMEYLDGQPLSRVLRATRHNDAAGETFTRATWLHVIMESLAGLHYAHELADYDGAPLCIVHRDVSPQNIFITYEGAVKIVDFGIAKATLNSTRTELGVLKGKAAYMAPEQTVSGNAIDRRADIFSVGVVLWEIFAKRRLFEGDIVTALRKLLSHDIPPIASVAPDVPPALAAIIMKALSASPDDRYASAAELRAALDGFLRSEGAPQDEPLAAKMAKLFGKRRTQMREQIKAFIDRTAAGMADEPAVSTGTISIPVISSSLRSLPTLDESGRADVSSTGSSPLTVDTGDLPVLADGGDAESSMARRGGVTTMSGAEPASRTGASRVTLSAITTMDSARPGPLVAPAASRWRGYAFGGFAVVAIAVGLAVGLGASRPQAPPAAASSAPEGALATGQVHLTTEPTEATVSSNGRILGKTPLRLDLPAGAQTLTLSRADYQDETLALQVPAGGTLERPVKLSPKAGAGAEPTPSARPSADPKAAPAPVAAAHGARAPTPMPTHADAPPSAPPPPTPPSAPPVAAQPAPAAQPAAAAAAQSKVKVVDDAPDKPMVKVNVVQ